MKESQRLLCFFWVVSIVQMRVQCNIRGKNGQFYASFNRVVANTKMKKTSQNFIKGGEFINHTLRNCVVECALEQRCNSINYHKKNEKCQLMKRTTTARENLLFKKDGWTFYETDPATRNIGHYCNAVSPCDYTHVCRDTYEPVKPYICRCKEGYTGATCKSYTGPGTTSNNTAGSCSLLKMRYPKLPNGFYWLNRRDLGTNKTTGVKQFCEMKKGEGVGIDREKAVPSCDWLKQNYPALPTSSYWLFKGNTQDVEFKKCIMQRDAVDGNWGQWSNFTECYPSQGGWVKNRTRSCNDPAPKFGGTNCSRDGNMSGKDITPCEQDVVNIPVEKCDKKQVSRIRYAEFTNTYWKNKKQEHCTRNVTYQSKRKCKERKEDCKIKLGDFQNEKTRIKDIYHKGEAIANVKLRSLKFNGLPLVNYSITVLIGDQPTLGDLAHEDQPLRNIHAGSVHLGDLHYNNKIFVDILFEDLEIKNKREWKKIKTLNVHFAIFNAVMLGDLRYSNKELRDIKLQDTCFTENGIKKFSVEKKCVEDV